MQKKIILLVFLFLLSCQPALAGLSFGASFGYLETKDAKYKDLKSNKLSESFGIGISERIGKDYFAVIQTNRLLNPSSSKKVINANGVVFDNKTRITSDSLFLAKFFGRTYGGFTLSNVGVNKKLYHNGRLVGSQKNRALLYGVSVGYLLTNHIATSISYIAPNKELGLVGASFININYFF